ncbi:flagellar protein [Oceanobacillus piezotolerans]|uniref:Flagellar protein n=2 Tax=Oceanobacillus piezotolerans TaxID=2448030 RepID=A0A498D7U8_9BACI|nr:flagellar protein [Oceanobacillus piezotolerans]
MEQDASVSKSDAGSGSLAFSLVKMFFALLLVLALIYILIKLLGKRNRLGNQSKVLENMGGISLGANKSIQIVRIGTKLYLVGVGENVQLLQEVTEGEVIDELLSKENSNGTLQESVLSMIDRKSAGKNHGDFKQLFASELDKLKQTRQKWQPEKEEDER